MCNSKEVPFDQSQEPVVMRNIGQQWFRCPGEHMLADNVIISASGFGLVLCDVFLVTSGPETGKRIVKAVKSRELEVYREG